MERNVLEYVELVLQFDFRCVRSLLATCTSTFSTPSRSTRKGDTSEPYQFHFTPAQADRSVPTDPKGGYSIEMYDQSIKDYTFPGGSYWVQAAKGEAPSVAH